MGVHKPEQYKVPAFDSFERFLFQWLQVTDIEKADFIFKPQYEFVVDNSGEIIVDYLARFENLDEDIAVIEREIGRSINLERKNETRSDLIDYRQFYKSNEMIEAVEEIYKTDIEMFNYSFE